MSAMSGSDQNECAQPPRLSKTARDNRAMVVSMLLREGCTPKQVSAGLKIIDAGGSVAEAMAAMRKAM